MSNKLTNAEYAILGLLVERPSHGYDLERLIEQRGMREWTELAFSSIYYLLKKLEDKNLVEITQAQVKKTRKTYAPTGNGYALHIEATMRMLAEPGPSYPSILLGMANWPSLKPEQALGALHQRRAVLEITLEQLIKKAPPGPEFISVLFEYSITQIKSELGWIDKSLAKLGDSDEN